MSMTENQLLIIGPRLEPGNEFFNWVSVYMFPAINYQLAVQCLGQYLV